MFRRASASIVIVLLLAVCVYSIWQLMPGWTTANPAPHEAAQEEDSSQSEQISDAGQHNSQAPQDLHKQSPITDASESARDPQESSEVSDPSESGQLTEMSDQPEPLPEVKLALVGDIMLGGRIDGLLRQHGFDYPYLHVGDTLRAADIAAGNLENPITDRGDPEDKQYTFRTHPDAVAGMVEGGFDVFNLANNHTLDYGLIGMRDTMTHLSEAGLGYMGAGENDEQAFRPHIVKKHGMRIDFLGFTNVVPHIGWKAEKDQPGLAETYNHTRAVEAIARSEEEADLVVVFVHWGIERQETPEPYMIEKARRYIDAGADLVVGSHPHVLGGIESYKDKWIAYSLGNFIFTVNPTAPSKDSAILQANCTAGGDCALSLVPVVTGVGQPVLATPEEGEAIFKRISLLSIGAEVNPLGEVVRLE